MTNATKTTYRVGIRTYSDYSPFGVELEGRTVSLEGYRFGFQNQEKDDEVKGEGNSVNYSFRMHDPRLGKFFAVDPLVWKYTYNSPYTFSENKVIHCLEMEGLEPIDINPIQYINSIFMADVNSSVENAETVILENVHVTLDVIGCIPVVGEIADGINGLIYTFEGDNINAAISYAAIIPIIGEAGVIGKYAVKLAKTADAAVTGSRAFKTLKGAQNYLAACARYGEKCADAIWDRSKLRSVLTEAAEATIKGEWRAHHLIPIATLKSNKTVQKAVEQGFDFNGVANGIGVSYARHKGSHSAWDKMVNNVIEAYQNEGGYRNEKELMEKVANVLEFRVKSNEKLTIQQIGEKYNKK